MTGQHPQQKQEESEEQQAPQMANPVEVVIHNAGLNVAQIPLPDGTTMTLLQFITNGITYTIKLDESGKKVVRDALSGGVEVVPAGALAGLRS